MPAPVQTRTTRTARPSTRRGRVLPFPVVAAAAALCAAAPARAGQPAEPPRYRVTDLGTLGGDFTDAIGLSNNGHVVGETTNEDFDFRAVLWQNGSMRDLGTLGGAEAIAFDVNDLGQVVGQSEVDEPERSNTAFLWDNGTMTDLGTLTPGQGFSSAHSINNNGLIVGRSIVVSGEDHAVVWENGRIRDLGTTGGEFTRSEANDINNRGRVVGNASGPGPVARAFQIEIDGDGMVSLVPTLGGDRNDASAVNDAGQVVGSSDTEDGQTRATSTTAPTGRSSTSAACRVNPAARPTTSTTSARWSATPAAAAARSCGRTARCWTWPT